MGEQNGLQFIRKAREAGYTGRIFVVTAGTTEGESVRALGQGVCGIFLKHNSPELLTGAIRRVMAGETWIDERCVRALVQAVDRTGEERRREFTERERGVLSGVFEGLSNKEIAARLGISEASV